ncbi:hypothetical protein RRG08_033663 [Elysia crispata]|uniref:Uncharacterized protein n=1 Tax=Elysia crispata TaxID=231223 RepID=A0AAE1A9D1_9GAST|nr:hypothetical protein RRG08_033663 [Elysia crispata]
MQCIATDDDSNMVWVGGSLETLQDKRPTSKLNLEFRDTALDNLARRLTVSRVGGEYTLVLATRVPPDRCDEGWFGDRCQFKCHCLDGDDCDNNGFCSRGCDPSWFGPACQYSCDVGTYGPNCEKPCSLHCAGPSNACHNVNGSCYQGCEPGYQTPLCEEACDVGTYGPNCEKPCSLHCAGPSNACHNVNGSCYQGCEPGYQTPLCEEVCDVGTFGPGCTGTCSPHCAGSGNNTCSILDGSCYSGCVPGYQAPICKDASASTNQNPTVIIIAIVASIAAIVMLYVIAAVLWRYCKARRRKKRVQVPIDDNVTGQHAGNSFTSQEPRAEARHKNRGVAISTQPIPDYDILRTSGRENDFMHTYATDFDPYDRIVENLYTDGLSDPSPTVESTQAADTTEHDHKDNDDDSETYIQMTDVRSSSHTPNAGIYSTIPTTNIIQLAGKEGDYLTTLEAEPACKESEVNL